MRYSSIQFWGDSVLRGVVFDEARGRYANLRESAAALLSGRLKIPVDNRSRMGRTAPEGLTALAADSSSLRGAAVVVEFGGNDCNHDWRAVAANPEGLHSPKVSPAAFADALTGIVDLIRARGGFPILATLPPLDAARFVRWVAGGEGPLARIREFLGSEERVYRWQEYYSSIVHWVSATRRCPCAPLREAFLRQPCSEAFLCRDGMHPNAAGQRLMADVLRGFFEDAERAGTGAFPFASQ